MNRISHIVLCGRTGDGKSSIANMLVQGDIYRDRENLFNIGNAAIGETRELTYARDVRFGVFDLVGLGELPSGGVPHDVALSRITKEDIRLFGVREKFRYLIVTHTGPSWTDDEKNVDETKRNFGDYPVISVDFPSNIDEDYAEIDRKKKGNQFANLLAKLSELNYSGNNPEVLSSSHVIENSLSNIINAVPVAGSLYQLTASGVYLMSGKPNAKKRFMNGAFGIFLDVVSFGAGKPIIIVASISLRVTGDVLVEKSTKT
ncbi:hypothetical protein RhiirC2_770311 [Rhizophagus irregularis]|uniref:AIG1-type G domain-containing protein n=1 Tax=Rhizophagus irregularis TaxID=588596 RepID=A0A2N1NWR9_9GLOM|nr:hypothetical protein RhiirC2_770311 [Rhizophagus irregularis]